MNDGQVPIIPGSEHDERIARLKELKDLADNLLAIPANEQCIGHFQMAMQKALLMIYAELAR